MHIVFIVGSYYPNYSAVGKCAGNVADELSRSHKVTVICQKNTCEQSNKQIYNNQTIIRVAAKDKLNRDSLGKKINAAKGVSKKLYRFLLNTCKLSAIVKALLSRYTINKDVAAKYVKALKSIEEPIDVIVSASMPFESVLAAVKYKKTHNSKVKVIPYLFDQFVESDTLHRFNLNKKLKRKGHLSLEKKLLQDADFILSMHSLSTHFKNNQPEINNIRYIEHPLVLNYGSPACVNNNEIKISYIGGLYKNYVTPEYLLELFTKTDISEAVLHFYIIGNCNEIVDSYSHNMPGKILNHGSVDKQTANNEVSKSNILISIAEAKGIQMSSKIFEYMSYGKPIVHFYSADNDVNLKILNKYPLALCLKQDYERITENARNFDKFCRENYASYIPFAEVEGLFKDASPKYTAELIVQMVTVNKQDAKV